MPNFTSLSDILNLATAGNDGRLYVGHKQTTIAGTLYSHVAGMMVDAWGYDGRTPRGATPSSVEAPTKDTLGAFEFTNASASHTKYLMSFASMMETDNHAGVLLYDRLLHMSGFSSTVTTAQTVGGTLTRNTGGEGNEIWLVVNTASGATPTTITASYTNQAGTSGRTTPAIAWPIDNYTHARAMVSLPLQGSDTGVRAVASVTLAGSTGTAGDFSVVVARPLAFAGASHLYFGGTVADSFLYGVKQPLALEDDSCLTVALLASTSTEQDFGFYIYTLEKAD